TEMHWRVPLDDEHTRIIWVSFDPSEPDEGRAPNVVQQPPRTNSVGEYTMDTFPSQDGMAFETPGPIFDRATEHLGESDRGIIMFRQMLEDQIDLVASGGDPMALAQHSRADEVVDLRAWIGGDVATTSQWDDTPVLRKE